MQIRQVHSPAVVNILGGFDTHVGCGGDTRDGRDLRELLGEPNGDWNVVIGSYKHNMTTTVV